MNEPTADWLTIAEAADRFGVPVRSLRRAVEKHQNEATNGAHDEAETRQVTRRTKTGERTAALFPVAFLERMAGEIKAFSGSDGQSVNPATDRAQNEASNEARTRRAVGGDEAIQGDALHAAPFDGAGHDGAFVAHLQAENARLWAALEQAQANVKTEQENTRAALAELQRANERAAVLIAATATGKFALPAMQATHQGEPSNEAAASATGPPLDATDATQQVTGGDLGADVTETSQSVGDAPEGAQRGKWWQIWKR